MWLFVPLLLAQCQTCLAPHTIPSQLAHTASASHLTAAAMPCPPCVLCCAVLRCAALRCAVRRCAVMLRCDATNSAELGIGREGGWAGQGQGRQAWPACTGLGACSGTLLIALGSCSSAQNAHLYAMLLSFWLYLILYVDKHSFRMLLATIGCGRLP